jgi:hypothetical protein
MKTSDRPKKKDPVQKFATSIPQVAYMLEYQKRKRERRAAAAGGAPALPPGVLYDWWADDTALSNGKVDSDSIDSWIDSHSGNDATQSNVDNQPRFRDQALHGRNYVEFNGSFLTPAVDMTDDRGAFFVTFATYGEQGSLIVCNGVALYVCIGNGNNFFCYTDQQNQLAGFPLSFDPSGVEAPGWQTMGIRFHEDGAAHFYMGGVKHSVAGANLSYIDRGGTALGSEPFGGGNFLHGGIARLMFYPSLLTDQQMHDGVAFLNNYYSL